MTGAGATRVAEVRLPGEVPLWVHPGWAEALPWVVQGSTGAGEGAEPFDLGLFGAQPVGAVLERWRRLRLAAGMRTAVHARQVHGAELCRHGGELPEGVLVAEGFDGHLTDRPGLMLAVSVADCVPVFLADPERRAVALVHAGWRGVAAGIVERALQRMEVDFGSRPGSVWVHCGPSICGECYEVGPEVHRGVRPETEAPGVPTPIDLRAAIAERVAARGVAPERVSLSAHCTRCGPGAFFSHRGGSAARQMGILGIRG